MRDDIQKPKDSRLKLTALFAFLFLVGCGETTPTTPKEKQRGDMTEWWNNNVGDGVPHRGSILNDGTEIVTIGQHNHGPFVLLIRYRDEARFSVYDQNGTTQQSAVKVEAGE